MIKQCDISDINQIIELGESWAEQYQHSGYDQTAWHNLVRSYCIHDNCIWLNFYNEENKIKGFMAGSASIVPGQNCVNTQIQLIFLAEGYQDHENLYELHRNFQDWSKKYNCVSIMAPLMFYQPEYVDNFFQELGYTQGPVLMYKGIE